MNFIYVLMPKHVRLNVAKTFEAASLVFNTSDSIIILCISKYKNKKEPSYSIV